MSSRYSILLQGWLSTLLLQTTTTHAFLTTPTFHTPNLHPLHSTTESHHDTSESNTLDFNAIPVAKTGGRGVISTAQEALEKELSLGAPGSKPSSGTFVTRGGVHVLANVESMSFVKEGESGVGGNERNSAVVMEELVQQLDYKRGVLLSSSYEFPGR